MIYRIGTQREAYSGSPIMVRIGGAQIKLNLNGLTRCAENTYYPHDFLLRYCHFDRNQKEHSGYPLQHNVRVELNTLGTGKIMVIMFYQDSLVPRTSQKQLLQYIQLQNVGHGSTDVI